MEEEEEEMVTKGVSNLESGAITACALAQALPSSDRTSGSHTGTGRWNAGRVAFPTFPWRSWRRLA